MKRRGVSFLGVVFMAALWTFGQAQAQTTVTNVSQFGSAFDQPGLFYPLVSLCEPSMFQPMDTWFLDFIALTNAVGAVTNYPGQTGNGVTAWPLRLIQTADTGEVVLKYAGSNDVELLRIAPPANYVAFATYGETLRLSAILSGWAFLSGEFHTSYADLIADGYTCLDPPRVVMDVWAIAVADEEAYDTNGVAVTREDEGGGPGTRMLMGTEACTNDGELTILSVSPDTNGWTTLVWSPTSTNLLYEIQATAVLSNPTPWAVVHTMIGDCGTSSWTDQEAAGLEQFFWRVHQVNFNDDADGDGLSNIAEFNLGTDMYSPDTDSDGLPDGVDADPLNFDHTPPSFSVTYPSDGATIYP